MPSIVMKNFGLQAARAFANSFLNDSIYFYVGKPEEWDEEITPDTPTDTPAAQRAIWGGMAGMVRITSRDVSLGIRRNDWGSGRTYEKYIDTSSSLGSGTGFCVLAGEYDLDVYKCLDNNSANTSTIKPTHRNETIRRETDGYIWKHMYSMDRTDKMRFATDDVIPVVEINSRPDPAIVWGKITTTGLTGSPTRARRRRRWIADPDSTFRRRNRYGTTAGPGTILNIPVAGNNSTGIGYNYRGSKWSTGDNGVSAVDLIVQSAIKSASATQLTLRASSGLPTDAHYFSNCSITMGGKIYNILDSTGKTALSVTDNDTTTIFETIILTLDSYLDSVSEGTEIKIGPKIRITGDGSGLTAIGNVNNKGNLVSIDVSSIGSGYSNIFSVEVEGNYHRETSVESYALSGGYTWVANGVGAYANIYIPPPGGHGYNPAAELDGQLVIISASLPMAGSTLDGDGFFVGHGTPRSEVDYRQIGLLRDPTTVDGNIAEGLSYDLRTHLYLDPSTVRIPGAAAVLSNPGSLDLEAYFPADSTVTSSNTGATGVIWNTPGENPYKHISLVHVTGNSGVTFSNGHFIQGAGGAGFISNINTTKFMYGDMSPISSALPGQMTKYSGEIIYHENIRPIVRRLDQRENFKLIFGF